MLEAPLVTLYLARRDAYAEFLSAADAESQVAWFRSDGRYKEDAEAIAAVDTAYAATRAKFNVIDVESVGPIKEARAVLEQLQAMHKDGGKSPDWHDFKQAREEFVKSAGDFLRGMVGEK
ncbi:hypothetical protein ACIHFE_18210 [Streptomyces sp. NPDC052396]|uniref:hypothetical protein n=1 Tax=Streptomyces sp. NPDC052396 TaxID=3365689 RepID=UPI0037D6820F